MYHQGCANTKLHIQQTNYQYINKTKKYLLFINEQLLYAGGQLLLFVF